MRSTICQQHEDFTVKNATLEDQLQCANDALRDARIVCFLEKKLAEQDTEFEFRFCPEYP